MEFSFDCEKAFNLKASDEGIGHTLKNIVDLTNWTQALPEVRTSIKRLSHPATGQVMD